MEKRIDPVKDLSSQRQRFTPSLFELLIEARALTPVRDGRYLDFDVFSNTQSETFGALVKSCSAGKKTASRLRWKWRWVCAADPVGFHAVCSTR